MPNEPERMMVDLTTIWKQLPEVYTESLFKKTVGFLAESYFFEKGLIKKMSAEKAGNGNGGPQ